MKYQRTPVSEIISHYGIAGIHPELEIIPEADDETFQLLCGSVAQIGFSESIAINEEGLLIDGRARLQVAWALRLEPTVKRFNTSLTSVDMSSLLTSCGDL
jgi:hypothetical protein